MLAGEAGGLERLSRHMSVPAGEFEGRREREGAGRTLWGVMAGAQGPLRAAGRGLSLEEAVQMLRPSSPVQPRGVVAARHRHAVPGQGVFSQRQEV